MVCIISLREYFLQNYKNIHILLKRRAGFMAEDIYNDNNDPPEAPSKSDCCNSGCDSCVFDIYERQLSKWENKELLRKRSYKIRYDLLSETRFKQFVLLKKITIIPNVYYLLRFQPKLETDEDLNHFDNLEQTIPGILPCTPGMHFIMKTVKDCFKQCSGCESDSFGLGNSNTRNLYNSNEEIGVECNSLKLLDEDISKTSDNSFVTRAYTPITLSDKESNCCFNIIVKLYRNGRMSEYISKLTIGDIVYFRGPYGEFCYNFNKYKRVLMLCIGTGIAPMYAVIKQILNNENDETVLKLLYGCRTIEDVLLRDELRNFTSYWNFTLKYFISSHVTDSLQIKFGEFFFNGRIDEKVVSEELNNRYVDSCLILVCGTDEFSKTILDYCTRHGVNKENIHIF